MELPTDLKNFRAEPHSPADTLIIIICFAVLTFFAAPDLVRWLYGMAP